MSAETNRQYPERSLEEKLHIDASVTAGQMLQLLYSTYDEETGVVTYDDDIKGLKLEELIQKVSSESFETREQFAYRLKKMIRGELEDADGSKYSAFHFTLFGEKVPRPADGDMPEIPGVSPEQVQMAEGLIARVLNRAINMYTLNTMIYTSADVALNSTRMALYRARDRVKRAYAEQSESEKQIKDMQAEKADLEQQLHSMETGHAEEKAKLEAKIERLKSTIENYLLSITTATDYLDGKSAALPTLDAVQAPADESPAEPVPADVPPEPASAEDSTTTTDARQPDDNANATDANTVADKKLNTESSPELGLESRAATTPKKEVIEKLQETIFDERRSRWLENNSNYDNQDAEYRNDERGVFGIFDGVGGIEDGAKAATSASRVLERDNINASLDMLNESNFREILEGVLWKMEDAVCSSGSGGTVGTFVKVVGDKAYYASVGDTRLYILGGKGEIRQITKDEGYENSVFQMIGHLNLERANEDNIGYIDIQSGDRLILLTDGITGDSGTDVVNDDELKKWVSKDKRPLAAVQDAIRNARKQDDRTIIVVDVIGEPVDVAAKLSAEKLATIAAQADENLTTKENPFTKRAGEGQ